MHVEVELVIFGYLENFLNIILKSLKILTGNLEYYLLKKLDAMKILILWLNIYRWRFADIGKMFQINLKHFIKRRDPWQSLL